MRLSRRQLADVLGILEKIDSGEIQPRVGDRIGRFLRQYESSRREARAFLSQQSVPLRSGGVISGTSIGPIELHALIEPEVDELAFPLGEVASTLAVSEQLGVLLNVRMWLNGGAARSTFSMLQERSSVGVRGDYRWTPLGQLTLGEAEIESTEILLLWRNARCLKAVADDITRPPHALEYVTDYRIGPPGLKYFRTLCATRRNGTWRALPCFGESCNLKVGTIAMTETIPDDDLLLLLVYREPWSNDWTIVRATAVQPAEVLEHALMWAHFRSEIVNQLFLSTTVMAARDSLRPWGVTTDDVANLDLRPHLLPVAKTLLRAVRGIG